MKLIDSLKNSILSDFEIYMKNDDNKKTILNIFLNPILEICKNQIFQELNNSTNNIEENLSNIIIEKINDYLYNELYPFFIFLFIMIIIIFILILSVIIIILKINK